MQTDQLDAATQPIRNSFEGCESHTELVQMQPKMNDSHQKEDVDVGQQPEALKL